jgi:hypothetical protein
LSTKRLYEDATIKASLISSASTPRLYGPRRVRKISPALVALARGRKICRFVFNDLQPAVNLRQKLSANFELYITPSHGG